MVSSPSVFLEKQQATSLISRQKRNVGTPSSTLEQACMEKVCSYEEAKKYFQDSYRTVSWSLFLPSLCLIIDARSRCAAAFIHLCIFSSRIFSGRFTLVSFPLRALPVISGAFHFVIDLFSVKMEISVQRTPARMEPCVQTA